MARMRLLSLRDRGALSALPLLMAAFLFGLLLLQGGVISWVVLRGLDSAFRELRSTGTEAIVESHVWALQSHFDDHKALLHDYAALPVFRSAVMQPELERPNIADFMSGMGFFGEHYCAALFDVSGQPVHQEPEGCMDGPDSRILQEIIVGSRQDHEALLLPEVEGEGKWLYAVPVRYRGIAEGVLALELPVRIPRGGSASSDNLRMTLMLADRQITSQGKVVPPYHSRVAPLWIEGASLVVDVGSSGFDGQRTAIVRTMLLTMGGTALLLGIVFYRMGSILFIRPQRALLALSEELEEKNESFARQMVERDRIESLLEQRTANLEASEARLRAVVEDQTELICRHLPSGEVTFVNEAYARYFGKDPGEIIGTTFSPRIPEEDQIALAGLLSTMTRDNPTVVTQHRVLLDTGEVRWQEWTERAVYDSSDTLVEYQSVGRDITDRKRLEKALQEANEELEGRVGERTLDLQRRTEELVREVGERKQAEKEIREGEALLQGILKGMRAAIVIQDCERGVVEEVNSEAVNLFAVPVSEIAGKPLSSLVTEIREGEPEGLNCTLPESGPLLNEEYRIRRRDGSVVPVNRSVIPIHRKGREKYAIIYFDETERKNLERQLAVAQKLESIGQLASGIAHEINTPIQYVGDNLRFLSEAFADISSLLDRFGDLASRLGQDIDAEKFREEISRAMDDADVEFLREEVPRSLEQSQEGAERVASIVLAMKRFSHPGGEEKKSVDLNKIVENTIIVAKNEWKYVADVESDLEPALPLVEGLPGDLGQVVLNILINASHAVSDVMQATQEPGKIRLTTRSMGGGVELRISDTGGGIPEDVRDKIFDPFFTTKEVGKGTGQGLAIVHDIVVNKHGGSIKLESEVGKGTTFILRLPVGSAPGMASGELTETGSG